MVSIPKVAAQVAGGALLATQLYDTHKTGVMKGRVYAANADAEGLTRNFLNSRQLEAPNLIGDSAKRRWFKSDLDTNIRKPFNYAVGYVKGFVSGLVYNIVPIALGVGAIALGVGAGQKAAGKKVGGWIARAASAVGSAVKYVAKGAGKGIVAGAKATSGFTVRHFAGQPLKIAAAAAAVGAAGYMVFSAANAIKGNDYQHSLDGNGSYK